MAFRKLFLSLLVIAAAVAGAPSLVNAFAAGGSSGIVGAEARPVAVTTGGLALGGTALAVGEARPSTITVRDTGGPGIFQIGGRFDGSALLGKQTRLVLSDARGRVVYSGSLSGFHRVLVGRIARGATRTLHASVELRSTGDASRDGVLQGLHGSFALTVYASAA